MSQKHLCVFSCWERGVLLQFLFLCCREKLGIQEYTSLCVFYEGCPRISHCRSTSRQRSRRNGAAENSWTAYECVLTSTVFGVPTTRTHKHTRAHTHTRTHMHTRTHTRTHMHTRTFQQAEVKISNLIRYGSAIRLGIFFLPPVMWEYTDLLEKFGLRKLLEIWNRGLWLAEIMTMTNRRAFNINWGANERRASFFQIWLGKVRKKFREPQGNEGKCTAQSVGETAMNSVQLCEISGRPLQFWTANQMEHFSGHWWDTGHNAGVKLLPGVCRILCWWRRQRKNAVTRYACVVTWNAALMYKHTALQRCLCPRYTAIAFMYFLASFWGHNTLLTENGNVYLEIGTGGQRSKQHQLRTVISVSAASVVWRWGLW